MNKSSVGNLLKNFALTFLTFNDLHYSGRSLRFLPTYSYLYTRKHFKVWKN